MTTTPPKITRDDLETKFVELQTGIDHAAASARDLTKKIGLIAAVALVVLAFLIGRRRGKLSKTVVEIRRL